MVSVLFPHDSNIGHAPTPVCCEELQGAVGCRGRVSMAVCAQREEGSLADAKYFGLPVQDVKAGVCVCSWNELAQAAEKVNVAECPWGSGAPCSDKILSWLHHLMCRNQQQLAL